MKRFALWMVLVVSASVVAAGEAKNDAGLINKESPHSVAETLDRLEQLLKKKGITVVTRWSHDAGADKAGIPLRPTELLIFGNPKMGSHFFTSNQMAGIDLPMKALAWQDDQGQVWLTYNDPAYIANRHSIDDRDKIVQKMTAALDALTNGAVKP